MNPLLTCGSMHAGGRAVEERATSGGSKLTIGLFPLIG